MTLRELIEWAERESLHPDHMSLPLFLVQKRKTRYSDEQRAFAIDAISISGGQVDITIKPDEPWN